MRIFVNYRRKDAAGTTGRICDRLGDAFGSGALVYDGDESWEGQDFVELIAEAIRSCDVCLVVIGPRWTPERIHEARDWVRLEIEAALAARVPLIPVLVEGASMPEESTLPQSVHPLLRIDAVTVDPGRDFSHHVRRLIAAIKRARARRSAPPLSVGQRKWPLLALDRRIAFRVALPLLLPLGGLLVMYYRSAQAQGDGRIVAAPPGPDAVPSSDMVSHPPPREEASAVPFASPVAPTFEDLVAHPCGDVPSGTAIPSGGLQLLHALCQATEDPCAARVALQGIHKAEVQHLVTRERQRIEGRLPRLAVTGPGLKGPARIHDASCKKAEPCVAAEFGVETPACPGRVKVSAAWAVPQELDLKPEAEVTTVELLAEAITVKISHPTYRDPPVFSLDGMPWSGTATIGPHEMKAGFKGGSSATTPFLARPGEVVWIRLPEAACGKFCTFDNSQGKVSYAAR